MMIDVAPGEVIDRLTILEIKLARIADPALRAPILVEFEALTAALASLPAIDGLAPIRADLKAINETLWQVEDDLRAHEQRKDFGAKFVELARSVYYHNDRRSALKRRISALAGSSFYDVKSYTAY